MEIFGKCWILLENIRKSWKSWENVRNVGKIWGGEILENVRKCLSQNPQDIDGIHLEGNIIWVLTARLQLGRNP